MQRKRERKGKINRIWKRRNRDKTQTHTHTPFEVSTDGSCILKIGPLLNKVFVKWYEHKHSPLIDSRFYPKQPTPEAKWNSSAMQNGRDF